MSNPRHLLDIDDLTPEELTEVLSIAAADRERDRDPGTSGPLEDRTLAMIFEKPSTRTRVSFEAGMTELGGHAIFLGPDDTQLGRGEPLKDTARALSRYVDVIMARVFDHADITELAAHATVPVINGLTDAAHPCQTLADLLTISDEVGPSDVQAAWVGDGNNVARSFAVGCAMCDIDLTVATPPGYGIGDDVVARTADYAGSVRTTNDPHEAVQGADVVYTDVWVSMGQEDERAAKLAAFEGFQVNESLLAACPDAVVMHCLPAHRGEEATDAVLESEQSVIWTQAENRLHAQNAVMRFLLGV